MHIGLFSGALQKKNRPLAHIAGIQNAKKTVSAAPYIAGTIARKPAVPYFQGAQRPILSAGRPGGAVQIDNGEGIDGESVKKSLGEKYGFRL